MKLEELIEYKPIQKRTIKRAEMLGLETEILKNPELTNEQVTLIYDLLVKNIPINPSHVRFMNKVTYYSYLKYGNYPFELNENRYKLLTSYQDVRPDIIVMAERLGVDYSSLDGPQIYEQILEKRVGSVDYEEFLKLLETEMSDISIIAKDPRVLYQAIYNYYSNNGIGQLSLDHELDGVSVSFEEYVLSWKFNEYLGHEHILDNLQRYIPEDKYKQDILYAANKEYELNDRCDIMRDTNYKLDERQKLLLVYEVTGIDLRLCRNIKTILNRLEHMVVRYDEHCIAIDLEHFPAMRDKIITIITDHLTMDDMKVYREMSNKYRNESYSSIESKINTK